MIIEFDLYLGDEKTIKVVDKQLGQINDAVLQLLRSKSIDDLQCKGGVAKLKR